MINGILAVNKPEGISSAGVVACVKRLLNARKVGHTGTLDPFATGVLLCAINKGTRISQFFLKGRKRYRATIRLGEETDTYDCTGEVVYRAKKGFSNDLALSDIQETVKGFIGVQQQVPPAFSALKKEGRPMYQLARKGIAVERKPRTITVFDLDIINTRLPLIEIDVYCSSGTYIRSIAYDIGQKLGCGAHLSALIRTQSSQFEIQDAISLAELKDSDAQTIARRVVPLNSALPFLPKIIIAENLQKKIIHGQRLSGMELKACDKQFDNNTFIRLVNSNKDLLAIVQYKKEMQRYNYSCVFAT